MRHLSYFKYILGSLPFFFLKNKKIYTQDLTIVLPANNAYLFFNFLRYSFFFKKTTLLDVGGYDIPAVNNDMSSILFKPSLWYIFKLGSGERLFCFLLQLCLRDYMPSIDNLFRNARWLEREASEFFGFFFQNKSDRRTLFTIPLFYNSPLRKKYPSVGFYEIFFCTFLKKLKFKYIGLQV